MTPDRLNRAMARIAAATDRIEAAAKAPRAQAPADPDLAHRHEALRREAWKALAELDTLI